jgi:hypothetical protein
MSKDPDPRLNAMPDKTPLERSLRPLVAALRELLETAGPEALPFVRDWPRELTPRPQAARSLAVVSALEGLSRFAAPQTQPLVEAVAALAGDLDWRQTYTSADFGERFLKKLWLERMDRPTRGVRERRDRLRRSSPRPRHRISRALAPGRRTLSPARRACLMAFRPVRLAAASAGTMDPSSLLDDPRHAHRSRAPARDLCLARRRPHGEVAPNLGSTGSVTDASRSQPSFSSTICSMATSALLALSGGSAW